MEVNLSMNQSEKKAIKYPTFDMLYDNLREYEKDLCDEIQKDLEEKHF